MHVGARPFFKTIYQSDLAFLAHLSGKPNAPRMFPIINHWTKTDVDFPYNSYVALNSTGYVLLYSGTFERSYQSFKIKVH